MVTIWQVLTTGSSASGQEPAKSFLLLFVEGFFIPTVSRGETCAEADRCSGRGERDGRGRCARAPPGGGHRGGRSFRENHVGDMLGSEPQAGARAVRLPEGAAGLPASARRQDLARRVAGQVLP